MKVFNILLFLLSVVHGTNIGTNEISLKLARNFAHNKLSILVKGEKKYFDVLVWQRTNESQCPIVSIITRDN